ncbi:hypothetical protein JTB14_009627 [Gonioctena quinquepunctata]|nr:hypothetical protein JTB14_009627 [Gonioctena quinquepunctata]
MRLKATYAYPEAKVPNRSLHDPHNLLTRIARETEDSEDDSEDETPDGNPVIESRFSFRSHKLKHKSHHGISSSPKTQYSSSFGLGNSHFTGSGNHGHGNKYDHNHGNGNKPGFGQNPHGGFGQNPYGGFGQNPHGGFGQNPHGAFGQNPHGGFGQNPHEGFGHKPDQGYHYGPHGQHPGSDDKFYNSHNGNDNGYAPWDGKFETTTTKKFSTSTEKTSTYPQIDVRLGVGDDKKTH